MKIIWFSNIILSDTSMSGTGTWISAMANSLIKTGNVELTNITKGRVQTAIRQDYKKVNQWIIPEVSSTKNGLPPSWIISQIQNIVDEIKPDIIHVWGTEYYWSRLTASGVIQGKILLEMQGLVNAIAEKITADLSIKEIIQCIGLKELVKPSSSILGRQKAFKNRGEIEKNIIAKHQFISTQSDWIRAHITTINPNAKIFNTVIGLRSEFDNSPKWKYEECERNRILTITSTISAYKGLHSLIKAFAVLSRVNQDAELYIAGPKPLKGWKQPGYDKYLLRLIVKEGIQDKVRWLGPLNTKELILQMLKCNLVVNPSFIESYSLVLKESLSLGVPTVVSYAGAMPELAIPNKTALFFPAGDIALCYYLMNKILQNPELANFLSTNAATQNNIIDIARVQLDIYNELINSLTQTVYN